MSSPSLTPAAAPVVLVVDDIAANRELLEAQLQDLGYDVWQARDGVEALEVIDSEEPDLVLLDVDMPRLDGLAVCREIKGHRMRRLIPVVMITAHQDRQTRLRGLAAGADDFLSKPFDKTELRIRMQVLLRDRQMNKQLDAAEGVVMALARVIEARDRYTVYHAERVGLYAREIGRARGLREDDLDTLYKGGVMHDLGKAVIPAEILLKRGPLDGIEEELMQRHPVEAVRIVEPLRSAVRFVPIIRHHHEFVDGRGYPDHLAGDEIPLGARIAGIADGWDAMTSDRPYRLALDREEALRRLRAGAGRQWDADLVATFVELLEGDLVEHVAREQLHVREEIVT